MIDAYRVDRLALLVLSGAAAPVSGNGARVDAAELAVRAVKRPGEWVFS